MTNKVKLFGLLLGVGLISILFIPTTMALEAGGAGIAPANPRSDEPLSSSWFIYEVNPGDVIEDDAWVINTSSKPLKIGIDAVDAISLGGGFGLLDSSQPNPNLGDWITLDKNETEVAPNSKQKVHFKIVVPQNPEVGDHIGGLVVQKIDSAPDMVSKSGGATVNIRTRVGARIYLTVLGDIHRGFKLLGKSLSGRGNKMILRFKVANSGNVRVRLKGDVKIYGIFGLYDERPDLDIGEIWQNKTSLQEIIWPGKPRPLFGPYWAIVTITDTYTPMTRLVSMPPASPPVKVWMFTFFIPYLQSLVLLLLVFLVWFFWQMRKWRQMVTLARIPVVVYKVKKGDHIMDVADEYEVSWKLLARLNDIKPPYSLHRLSQIYVPDVKGSRRDMRIPHFLVYLTKPFRPFFGLLTSRFLKKKKPYYEIVVEKGDAKKNIEEFTGMTWAQIAKYNGIGVNIRLKVGQELKVPKTKRKS